MGVKSSLRYIYKLKRKGIKLGLERMDTMMGLLGNPQNSYKTVHVTGTNGKGSVSTYIYSVLKEQGYSTAIYTSPHLVKFNERIVVDGNMIDDRELIELIWFIRKKISGKVQPTFSEFTTALAFLYFARKKVDIAVIEVCMGGKYDATNVIIPIVSVITYVDYDHEEYLGNKPIQIASEKAGIIKSNTPLVTAEAEKEIVGLFKKICQKQNCRMYRLGTELKVKQTGDCRFTTKGVLKGSFKISMKGDHQITNAGVALLALDLIKKNGICISDDSLKKGLLRAIINGRLQSIGNILLDGAHNPSGMQKLFEYIRKIDKRIILVIAIKEGKKVKKLVSLIAPLAKKIIITEANFMPASIETLEKEIKKYGKEYLIAKNPKIAMRLAKQLATNEDIILVTGSLYLVGDVLSLNKNRGLIKYQY